MLRFFVFVVGSLFMLTSCAHAPKTIKARPHPRDNRVYSTPAPAQVTGSVLDEDVLSQGGNIALVPFKAGANAEATDELDKLSLRVLKGIADSIESQKKNLHVVEAENGQPRMALQGYVEDYAKVGGLSSHMMLQPDLMSFSLSGEVWLISNGQRLMNFATSKKFDPKKERASDVAYSLGKDIGNYITSYVK